MVGGESELTSRNNKYGATQTLMGSKISTMDERDKMLPSPQKIFSGGGKENPPLSYLPKLGTKPYAKAFFLFYLPPSCRLFHSLLFFALFA